MRHRIDLGNWKSMIGTTVLAAGLTLFAGAGIVKGDDECQERIERADHHLHEAIEHHGYESKQAHHWRMELRNAREYCWEHSHHWWDVEGRRWHTDRDWDDNDHEHYRHHDRDYDRDHDRQ
jgi:hypothetical protein